MAFNSPAMILNFRQLLLDRLKQQGVNTDETPAVLRGLFKTLELNPSLDQSAANPKLQLLGWNGAGVHYQSPQLVLAWVESKIPRQFRGSWWEPQSVEIKHSKAHITVDVRDSSGR